MKVKTLEIDLSTWQILPTKRRLLDPLVRVKEIKSRIYGKVLFWVIVGIRNWSFVIKGRNLVLLIPSKNQKIIYVGLPRFCRCSKPYKKVESLIGLRRFTYSWTVYFSNSPRYPTSLRVFQRPFVTIEQTQLKSSGE